MKQLKNISIFLFYSFFEFFTSWVNILWLLIAIATIIYPIIVPGVLICYTIYHVALTTISCFHYEARDDSNNFYYTFLSKLLILVFWNSSRYIIYNNRVVIFTTKSRYIIYNGSGRYLHNDLVDITDVINAVEYMKSIYGGAKNEEWDIKKVYKVIKK